MAERPVIRITHDMVQARRAAEAYLVRQTLKRAILAGLAPGLWIGIGVGPAVVVTAGNAAVWNVILTLVAAFLSGGLAAGITQRRCARVVLPNDVALPGWVRQLPAASVILAGVMMALVGGVAAALGGGVSGIPTGGLAGPLMPLWVVPLLVASGLGTWCLAHTGASPSTATAVVTRRARRRGAASRTGATPARMPDRSVVRTPSGVTVHPVVEKRCPARCNRLIRPGDPTLFCTGPERHEVHEECARTLMKGKCPLCQYPI